MTLALRWNLIPCFVDFLQTLTYFRIDIAGDMIQHFDNVYFAAYRMIIAGHFQTDDTAADDQVFQVFLPDQESRGFVSTVEPSVSDSLNRGSMASDPVAIIRCLPV